MAKHTIWNIGKANAEISAADAAINPLLESAKLTTLKVNGADVPASDAPLVDKINALAAVSRPGAGTQDMSDLVATNDSISRQLTEVTDKLAISSASVATLQRDNAKLSTDLNTAQASVSTLTASNAELQNRHDASIRQVGDLTRQANAVNAEVSRMGMDCGCLDLADENSKPLAKDAAEDVKLAAANRIPITDKLKAVKGAVNAAASRVGVQLQTIPSTGAVAPANANKKLTVDEEIRQAKAAKK